MLQEEREEKRADWGKEWKNGKIAPSGRKEKASVLGERVEKSEVYSKWNERRSERVGVNSIKFKNLFKNKEKCEKRG